VYSVSIATLGAHQETRSIVLLGEIPKGNPHIASVGSAGHYQTGENETLANAEPPKPKGYTYPGDSSRHPLPKAQATRDDITLQKYSSRRTDKHENTPFPVNRVEHSPRGCATRHVGRATFRRGQPLRAGTQASARLCPDHHRDSPAPVDPRCGPARDDGQRLLLQTFSLHPAADG